MSKLPKPVSKNLAHSELTPNPENIRFNGTTSVMGIQTRDTRNIGTMRHVLTEHHGYPAPFVVEDRGDVKIVLAGNRRWYAADEIQKDPNAPEDLKKELAKVPCLVYKDLTPEQRNELVNDQRSQKFMRSELVAYIFKLHRNGWGFNEIAMHVWSQMGQYTGSGAKMLAKVEAAKTDAEKKKAILSWLKGTLDQLILACSRLGPRVQKALLLKEMQTDGISPPKRDEAGNVIKDESGNEVPELPEFYPSQGRCNELLKIKKEDEAVWTPEKGSPRFNDKIAEYNAQDFKDAARPKPRPSVTDLKEQRDQRTKSKAAKEAFNIAMGETSQVFADWDDEAKRLEELTDICVEFRNDVKDENVKKVIQAFLSAKPHEFRLLLVSLS